MIFKALVLSASLYVSGEKDATIMLPEIIIKDSQNIDLTSWACVYTDLTKTYKDTPVYMVGSLSEVEKEPEIEVEEVAPDNQVSDTQTSLTKEDEKRS